MEEKKLTQLCTRIPETMLMEVKHRCVDERITVTDFVKNAIMKELKGD